MNFEALPLEASDYEQARALVMAADRVDSKRTEMWLGPYGDSFAAFEAM